jgi:hypothetical protein
MFYVFVVDDAGNVVDEIEEDDYESFIVKCYNFREHESLDKLHVFHVQASGDRVRLSSATIEEMIESWLDPDFMFALGYPLPH